MNELEHIAFVNFLKEQNTQRLIDAANTNPSSARYRHKIRFSPFKARK